MTSLASFDSSYSVSSGTTTTIGRGREGQTEYIASNVPIARGLNYGSARSKTGGGLSNRSSGMGAGERYGMSAGSVKGLGRKVKPLKLQNGATVYIDLLCGKCGYENLPNHKRLRCDTCGVPLPQLHPDDANAGKNTLHNYTGQDVFSPASSNRLRRKAEQRKHLAEYQTTSMSSPEGSASASRSATSTTLALSSVSYEQQLSPMAKSMGIGATMRDKGGGGLSNKRTGMGPGARHVSFMLTF